MSTRNRTFFSRLDARFPFLKVFVILALGTLALLDLLDLTISKTNDPVERTILAPMQYHVRARIRDPEGKMLVALTFDDGPSPATTPTLLDILYEKDVPATFFMLGNLAKNNPDLVRRVDEEGHEVASHTMYHQNLIRISAKSATADINAAKAVFESILGKTPVLTRPPYGNINNTVRTATGTPLILWSVDTLDWKYKTTESIMGYIDAQVYDGAIILMHDIHETSVAAVPTIIDTLRARGYEFVTVSELAALRGRTLTPGTAYYNLRP